MKDLFSDFWYSLRRLRNHPGFTAVAVVTLALGIGANTAIFSVVHSILLRPLPVSEPDRLVNLCEVNPAVAGFCVAAPPNVEDWSRHSHRFDGFGIARGWPHILRTDEGAEGLAGGLATPGFFAVLRFSPLLGRLFVPDDLPPGNHRVVVLSHALWMNRFGGDRDIVGRSLTLDDENYTVVGVFEAQARVPQMEGIELWTPLHFDPRDEEHRAWRGFKALGRLRANVSVEEAQTEMDTLARRLAVEYPETNAGWDVEVVPLHERVVAPARRALLVFLAAVGCVLLIGCANVANLLLARGAGRRRELAVRTALGAGRLRLMRLLLSESLLLSSLGAAAGLLLAWWAVEAFVALAPSGIPRLDEVAVDGRMLAWAVILSLLTSMLSGLVPSLQAAMLEPNQAIKEGGEHRAGGPRLGTRGLLVISEVALALMLLVGAALLTRSFASLLRWQSGFDQDNLLVVWLLASSGKYSDGDQVANLFEEAAREVQSLPAVVSVGRTSAGPLFGGREPDSFHIVGRRASGDDPIARWFDVGPNYFRTLGVPLIRGRHLTDADVGGSLPVALINETMARRHWPVGDPIGARVVIRGKTRTVVGVVGDVQPFRPGTAIASEIYWPQRQAPRWATFLVIRTDAEPATLIRPVRQRLRELDPAMQVSSFATMDQLVGRQLVRPRFDMLLVGIFATVALVLAAVGIYGVIAYTVAHRTREIGIRIALGARRGSIVRSVVGGGMVPVLIGVAAGLALAFGLSRLMTGLLSGVGSTDPLTFAGMALALIAVAALACYLPARRATKVDPMLALREE